MELPSINSTTSISDNADLRSYYDKLLFRNASGKSLTDLPRKAQASNGMSAAGSGLPGVNVNETIHEEEPDKPSRIDFIDGYDYSPKASATMSPPQEHARRRSIFFENSIENNGNQGQKKQSSSSGGNMTLSPEMMLTSMNSSSGNAFLNVDIFNDTRRSSYIADSLIHHQSPTDNHYLGGNSGMESFNGIGNTYQMNSMMMQQQHQQQQQSHQQPRQQQPFSGAPYVAGNEFGARRNSQPVMVNQFQNSRETNNRNFYGVPQDNYRVQYSYDQGYYNQKQPQTMFKNSFDYNNKVRTQQNQLNQPQMLSQENAAENGLVVLNGKQLASSEKLHQLYLDSGSNYFSSKQVFEFMDYLKPMLEGGKEKQDEADPISSHLYNFLGFLKSCNLNYNPQSEAFVTTNMNNRRNNGTTSSYLHYKPLVLGALKNGKLELLSTPPNSNLLLKKGDLAIVDGDRGKDLVLVVEPSVNLNLALIINFLKKKIHFDSLITNKSQHYPNNKFVKALIDSTNGLCDELNPKLYDIIELTQLVVPSKQVLRFANSWEVTTNLHNKFQDELKALHIAQLKLRSLNSGLNHNHRSNNSSNNSTPPNETTEGSANEESTPKLSSNNVSNSVNLNIKILNAEFQFDRKKLTFYYVCEERNDFRELIKELFKFYKTRIWLCAIPNNLDIDRKYYDPNRKELEMYQKMMQHYSSEEGAANQGKDNGGNNHTVKDGLVVAPPLKSLELDNFQIGVYKELVNVLFDTDP